MNIIAPIGHNQAPNPIDEALAPYGDIITEAESWLDGTAVENEGQMKAVDSLLKSIKAAKKAVENAEESAARPIYDAWKAEKAKFAPTVTDLDRIAKGLVAAVDVFKRKVAAEKEAARKEAERAAWEATRKAQEAARQADPTDIEATRAAAQIEADALAAQKAATAANNDTVKGLRWYDMHEVEDHKALLNWIVVNDREAVTQFIEDYAAKNHKRCPMNGVKTWREQRAF
jgi:hypothetical protein